MRRMVALLLLVLAAIPPPAQAVTPDAHAYIVSFGLYGQVYPDSPEAGDRFVRFALGPTGDAPAGNVSVVARVRLTPVNGSTPPRAFEAEGVVPLLTPGERRPGWNTAILDVPWDAPWGLYVVEGELVHRGPAGERVWDKARELRATGWTERLGEGWGVAPHSSARERDLDGDGEADVHVVSGNASVAARDEAWESLTRHGWTLGLLVRPEGLDHVVLRVDGDFLRRVVHARSPEEAALQVYGSTAWQRTGEGDYELTLPGGEPQSGVHFQTSFPNPFPVDLTEAGWYDGYRMRINLSSWDLDGDALVDLAFFEAPTRAREDALRLVPDDRRREPVDLLVEGVVTNASDGPRVDFDVTRTDGREAGAWIEVRNGDALARLLGAPGADVSVEVDGGGDAGAVQPLEGSTWVWLGHFSTRRVSFVAQDGDPPPGDGTPPTGATLGPAGPPGAPGPEDGGQGNPVPAPGPVSLACAVAAVALASAAHARRPRRARRR